MENILKTGLSELSITLSGNQQQQLMDFVALLDKWNKAYNLTSVRQPKQMMIRHILDSLAVSKHLQGERFIDVGTGPGLPGIPLAIVNPEKQFVLLDSLGKRVRFQKQVIHELKLNNVEPINSRVEQYQSNLGFDMVLSRAFASLKDMLEWCQHLPNEQGCFLALKANIEEQELTAIQEEFKVREVIPLQVPYLDEPRHLVSISRSSAQSLEG
ncbi:16S rRNA (guanine(527)-N(7))-methyltransferase RsmG [Paraferrimonas haliotis]|uniref:Ribosomal RNA small subunit methyltransferase G n=1 Tax=Paraferrimonas haliotis TaxID=2013866 RepID=A0AA37WZD2_9GAMM|nr:16S rRNA (guanine(527)-N(7))-methyltransferase RsmG [Paraferrimonas haliotis]GLS84800.1 ribosomal RNA small subunit methyltransferase G [Paraferrimonas haliotis]